MATIAATTTQVSEPTPLRRPCLTETEFRLMVEAVSIMVEAYAGFPNSKYDQALALRNRLQASGYTR